MCYRDAWEVAHPAEPGWTLDPANEIVSATMPGWPYGVWASDHAGLMTDLAPYPERRASGTGSGEPGGTERRVS